MTTRKKLEDLDVAPRLTYFHFARLERGRKCLRNAWRGLFKSYIAIPPANAWL